MTFDIVGLIPGTFQGDSTGITGTASIAGTATVTADGFVERFASASTSGTATVTTDGFVERFATASPSGLAAVTTSGFVERFATASSVGVSAVTASGVIAKIGSASISGTTLFSVSGFVNRFATTHLPYDSPATYDSGGTYEAQTIAAILTVSVTATSGPIRNIQRGRVFVNLLDSDVLITTPNSKLGVANPDGDLLVRIQ